MVKQVPLTQGHVALVDDEDYELVMAAGPWQVKVKPSGVMYARSTTRGEKRATQYMHHLLTGWSLTDHVNRDGLDNRRANLRPATRTLNRANSGRFRTNTSGYVGVQRAATEGKWKAVIQCEGKSRYLGTFAAPEEAALAYDAALFELYGEYARLNFRRQASA